MSFARKRFDRQLWEQTDKLAKQAAMKLLDGSPLRAVENKNRVGVDLLIYNQNNQHVGYMEVEIKRNWKKGEDFKYPNVNFLERKKKYCGKSKPTTFIIFNEDLSQYLAIKDSDVLSSPLEEVKNKYVYEGEMFYKVPLDKVKFNTLEGVI